MAAAMIVQLLFLQLVTSCLAGPLEEALRLLLEQQGAQRQQAELQMHNCC